MAVTVARRPWERWNFSRVADIHIRHAIAIRHHEGVAIDVPLDPLDPAAGHRLLTRIRQRHTEILLVVGVEIVDPRLASQVNREIIIHCFIIQEIFFDHLASVAQAEHEISVAVVGVEFHDVPDDRLLADQDHGLGPELRLFSEASSLASAKDDDVQLSHLAME